MYEQQMIMRRFCWFLTILATQVAARNSYFFSAPNTIRPGRDLAIQGRLLEKPKGTVTLTATITKAGIEVASTVAHVTHTNNIVLDIPIPSDLEDGIYDLSIKGRGGGVSFDKTTTLTYEKKSISIYIQTDKKVYKPGQTIHFRVFATDPDLQIVTDKLLVELFDPKGTKINQWERNVNEIEAVHVEKQWMSEYPEFGNWKLVATMRAVDKDTCEHGFFDQRHLVTNMKFNQLFDIFQNENDCSDDKFIGFNQFYTYLRSKDKTIKNGKIRRAFQSYSGGIQEINGSESVNVKSVLKYSFNNEKSEACRYIADIVQQELLKYNETVSSCHDLYKLIAKTKFQNVDVAALQSSAVNEEEIDSLITDHKPNFTKEEWAKIVWFERHFSKTVDCISSDYEDIVSLKYSKFQSILSFKEACGHLADVVNKDIKTREKRLSNAEELNKVELKASEKHLAHVLDTEIQSLLNEYTDSVKYVAFYDTGTSKQQNTLQLAFSVNKADMPYDLQDICSRIYYHVLRKHTVCIESIYVFNEEDLIPFFIECNPARFRLRDSIQTQNINGLVYKWVTPEDFEDLNETEHTDNDQCEVCFNVSKWKPLTNKAFDVVQEWVFEVPIEIQMLLETFVNKYSLRTAQNRQTFVHKKLNKIHMIYDQLLNVYNKNYIGIQQRANTNELLVEYKSVSSVFDITSASGASCSLRQAESNAKKLADEDMCYYNTYLKEYKLQYHSVNGPCTESVSLRDCHCILMLDNLVRFSFLRNTARDEKSSNQLPTLPMTIQGMPMDSEITKHWHHEDCDGTEQCHCKKAVVLGKADVDRTLLQLSPYERENHENFFQLITWSSALLWRNITDEIMEHIDDTDTDYANPSLRAEETTLKGVKEEKIFEVAEYVLPKFEVTLDLPTFGRAKDNTFEGKVIAKYTFGKPVKGTVDLSIRSKRERFVWRNNQRESTNKEIELNFPIDGEAKFTVSMAKLKELERYINGETLVFEANVTESLTRFKLGDKEEVKFYDNPIKVEFAKSAPDTFKPGMPYIGLIKVSLVDGTPPESISGNLKLTVTETIVRERRYEREPWDRPWWRRWRHPPPPPPPIPVETTRDQPVQNLIVEPDGMVHFKFETSDKVKKISVKAEYGGSSDTKALKKRHSPSDNFLQVTTSQIDFMAGKSGHFEVRHTEHPGEISYQIYSRGRVVDFGSKRADTRRNTDLHIQLTQAMAPRSTLVVFYIRRDGEVVADSITVNIQGVFKNKVGLAFNKPSTKPGQSVDLRVSAEAGSRVNLLAVDKSVQLLGTGNDITKDEVLQELQAYNNKGKSKKDEGPPCFWCWRWPLPSGGEDVKDVFEDAGVVVLTDALIYEHVEPPPPPIWDGPRPVPFFGDFMRRGGGGGWRAVAFAGAAPMADVDVAAMPMVVPERSLSLDSTQSLKTVIPKENLAPVTRTRKLFPETWLWEEATVNSSGSTVLTRTVPDTITSWVATAFATHPHSGLGLMESPAQIEVSKKFFVSLQLPYSVIRGEQIVLQANVFNYNPETVSAWVVLTRSDDFDNIKMDGNLMSTSSSDITRSVTIAPGGVEAVYFPILPTTLGRVKVTVRAQSATEADELTKDLLVEAEGSPREYNIPMMIDLKELETFTKTVTVEYPPRTVPGSERVEVTVIGDIMGKSLKDLDKLLKMPYGCGEQNMLNFAPNIFIIKYLEAVNDLDSATMEKAKGYMEKGLQRELTYRHGDGSFSAFGERDESGSSWLTAFVLKSFVQAKPYIFIDDKVIIKMVDWLVKHQSKGGSFLEPGRVIHKAMQGGSTSGEVSRTAYILISLLEARIVEGVAAKVDDAKAKAQKFLEDQLDTLTDVYDLAIVSYALQLAGSLKAQRAWDKLDQKAQTNGGLKWWQKELASGSSNVKPWAKRSGQAINIEMTAYALLTLASKSDTVNGLPILKWITEQRNPNGGFSSTQDTVVALHALSEMAALIYSGNIEQTITLTGKGFRYTITVDSRNARILQTFQLPADAGDVTVSANGRGLSLLQVEVFYNIDDDDQKKSFLLSATLLRETLNDYDIRVCASWTEPGSSSMAILEIGSPSGFIADEASVASAPNKPKRTELAERKLVLYYDEIGREDTCVTVTMHRIGQVAAGQPVPIHVYDYYEPTKQVTMFYVPNALRESTVCDVCLGECSDFCTNMPPRVQ